MKTPSTKDTIGCATEVKQPPVPKGRVLNLDISKLPTVWDEDKLMELMKTAPTYICCSDDTGSWLQY